jgi:hypothetical protein
MSRFVALRLTLRFRQQRPGPVVARFDLTKLIPDLREVVWVILSQIQGQGQNIGSMQVSILRRRYSSSRRP